MKRPRHSHRKPAQEFPAVKCELCGAPHKMLQALNLPPPKGAPLWFIPEDVQVRTARDAATPP